MRRSPAAWQAVSLSRGFRESECLLAGLGLPRRRNDGALRRLLQRIDLRSPRRKRATAFVHDALLDREAALFQGRAKALVRHRFLSVPPTHQDSADAEEIPQPVQGRLELPKRASPPIDKRNVVLTGW